MTAAVADTIGFDVRANFRAGYRTGGWTMHLCKLIYKRDRRGCLPGNRTECISVALFADENGFGRISFETFQIT